jgi:hypothetical protein
MGFPLHSFFDAICVTLSHRVSSESSEHTEVEVNSAAVAGITSTSIGLGHANLSQFSSMLNMPSMSQNAYKKIEGDMRTKFYDSLSDLITQAGREEKIARERGDIDLVDGYYSYC